MTRLIAALCALLSLAALPTILAAQDGPTDTILVLDGSGSMWGQIDGVNKIVIARDAVGAILGDVPGDQNLGLVVYGHRTRGDCSDIETVIAPAPGTADAIRDFAAGINPRGMTPMTDSVVAAAEALRSTERAATVILVSDGIETCNPDPCAAARVLEETGVDFTAHVIGFDVSSEPEALAQMECLAAETGGLFLTADNAAELSGALQQVVEANAAPPAAPATITLEARIGADGPLVEGPVLWTLDAPDEAPALLVDGEGNPYTAELSPGDITATAYWTIEETTAEATFTVGTENAVQVVAFPEPVLVATLEAADSAPLGGTLSVDWTGPDEPNDYIAVGRPGEDRAINYTYTRDGAPLPLVMPPEAGTYELRYVRSEGDRVLATRPVTVTEVAVSLDAPEDAAAGADVTVTWEGPDYDGDYIAVGLPGEGGAINYAYTRDGAPAALEMPVEPGEYEIRYVLAQGDTVLATRPIAVSDLAPTLQAPETAMAGETVQVAWDGPDYDNDYIAVGRPGEDRSINYTRTRDGNPASLMMPVEPGEYEIRYVLDQGNAVVATRPITVSEVAPSLEAPETAVAGETVQVAWDGPDYDNDYIAVGLPGEDRSINYTRTRDGNPLGLMMPVEPGEYEIRYVLDQGNAVVATRPITISEVKPVLEAAESAPAGSDLSVAWEGPDYDNDYIAVGLPGEDRSINYTRTRDGNPTTLLMPVEPGEYEIRYVLDQGNTIVARRLVTVEPIEARLVAPQTGAAGGTVMVGWDGPDYANDYIAIGVPGEDRSLEYARTNRGNPVELDLPEDAGTYELRYVLDQGNSILARTPFTVE
ncbi:VWA domain-containing protein [Wenxinia saemankumensis]|uniref:Ca-activated chloride channel family protein n=1 Tax=Wenxinia saemankumensis TaxID=1447782 RepID=A0A1M6GR30_9RHOB|nr:VWA domain-containing protein [Wenxinia saemankumensis]SHJ12350.1 Ca-activated chloride channel family protein [Wenxinia saemankumensis]